MFFDAERGLIKVNLVFHRQCDISPPGGSLIFKKRYRPKDI